MGLAYTDIPFNPRRLLTKQFDSVAGGKGGDKTKAVGTAAPNTLSTNAPSSADAMGIAPADGIVCFWHDGASQNFTIYYWNSIRNKLDSTKGWIKAGEGAAINTKTVDPESGCEIKVPAGCPYFLQAATSPINNLCVHDGGPFKANLNTDNTVTT